MSVNHHQTNLEVNNALAFVFNAQITVNSFIQYGHVDVHFADDIGQQYGAWNESRTNQANSPFDDRMQVGFEEHIVNRREYGHQQNVQQIFGGQVSIEVANQQFELAQLSVSVAQIETILFDVAFDWLDHLLRETFKAIVESVVGSGG